MFSFLRLVVAFLLLSAAGVTTLILQASSYFVIRPFSLKLHRSIATRAGYGFFLLGSFLLHRWASVRIQTYGDVILPGQSSLIIVNHSTNVDWLIGLSILAHLGYPSPGNVKCVVKASLGSVPIFGWILRFCEFIFLTRSWAKDRVRFVRKLRSLATYPVEGTPLLIVLFPEGSRLTPEKLVKTQLYSKANSFPVFDHVLLPRFKGFTATIPELRPALNSIVDVSCMVQGMKPSLSNVFNGTCNSIVHLHMRTYEINQIPRADEDMQNWLLERWREKEERIAHFKNNPASLGAPHESTPLPTYTAFYALICAFLLGSAPVLYAFSRIPNGLQWLASFTSLFCVAVGIFVAINLKPSKKGK